MTTRPFEEVHGLVLGHALGGGGPHIEVLVVAVALMWLGVLFYFRKAVKPVVSVALILASLVLAGGSFVMGGAAQSGAGLDISLVSPEDGARVEANRPVEVDVVVRGGRIVASTTSDDPNAGHVHVFVDGDIVDMPTTARSEVELKPGRHAIAVEFVDVLHRPFDPPVTDEIEVEAR